MSGLEEEILSTLVLGLILYLSPVADSFAHRI